MNETVHDDRAGEGNTSE